MYTYTTPTITCTLQGAEFSQVDYVRVAFVGRLGRKLVKSIDIADIDAETGQFVIHLTQRETAMLGAGSIDIQARVRYNDGTVQSTAKITAEMKDMIDKVVI